MNRYPGIRPFVLEDKALFNGREQEKRDLFQLIVLHDLVVLFGKSGTGKSSLLQAGVCPDLENRNLHSVFVRFNNTNQTPETQVYHRLLEGGYLPDDLTEGLTLWEYFKKFWYADAGEAMEPVVVFDQFEELFTLYTPEARQAFISQLASVANGMVPQELRTKGAEDWATPPRVKFVFSIRSDYLYLLDDLSSEIPAILRCRFQLKALGVEGAKKAITAPAAMSGKFESPSYSYHQSALDEMIESLGMEEDALLKLGKRGSEGEIEASQLQLLCRHIEQKIIADGKPVGFKVLPEYYGGKQGIKLIISDFYTNIISKLKEGQRDKAEKLMGRGLIRNSRRIIMEESVILEEFGLTKDDLDVLENERLLKQEARKGNFYYEISHDTLVEPILQKYKSIADRELKEQQELELEAERQKRKKARRLAVAGFGLSLLTIVALTFALLNYRSLQRLYNVNTQLAYDAKIQAARTLKVEGKYDEALVMLNETEGIAQSLGSDKIGQVLQLEKDWLAVNSLMEKGDSLSQLEAYYDAKSFYTKANEISPDDGIKKQILQNEAALAKKFNELKHDGEQFLTAGAMDLAKDRFEKALKLKPGDYYILERLKKIGK